MRTKSAFLLFIFSITIALFISCKENKTSDKSWPVKRFQKEGSQSIKISPKSNKNKIVYCGPDSVILTGRIKIEKFYGAPSFGEDPKHDKIDEEYILHLDKPVDVRESPSANASDYDGIDTSNISTIQISMDTKFWVKIHESIGKKITLKGTLSGWQIAHDHLPVLLEVVQVIESKN